MINDWIFFSTIFEKIFIYMIKKLFLPVILSILVSPWAVSQTPSWEWVNSAQGNDGEIGSGISTDAAGNCYVTGHFGSTAVTFGSFTLLNFSPISHINDVFIVKYDPQGNVLWARSAGGSSIDEGIGIATDAAGNSYVIGRFGSPTITFGTFTLTNNSTTVTYSDIFIVKYDSAGNVLWAKSAGGISNDLIYGVSIDPLGNAYITGNFPGPTIIFDSDTLTTSGVADAFIVKFDSAGNVLWARSAGGVSGDGGMAVSSDVAGNCYVTGYFVSPTISFGNVTLTNSDSSNTLDVFVVKYDPAGNLLWAKSGGGSNNERTTAISTDALGNCFVTGWFVSPAITFGSLTLTNYIGSTKMDFFIIKYDPAGNLLWAKSVSGSDDEYAWGLTTDNAGNSYLTGFFESPILTLGSLTLTKTGAEFDIFIVNYDSAGNTLWAKCMGGNDNDGGRGISLHSSGNLYIAGYFISSSVTFDSFVLANSGSGDVFVGKIPANYTGIHEVDFATQLSMYPNPSTDAFTIQLENDFQNKNLIIELVDIKGKVIFQTAANQQSQVKIATKDFNEGLYIVQVLYNDAVVQIGKLGIVK